MSRSVSPDRTFATPPNPAASSLTRSLALVLDDLEQTITGTSPEVYSRPGGALFEGSSIGGHVRHTLDHARALLGAQGGGVIDYDRRERGTPVERDPEAALAAVRALRDALTSWSTAEESQPVEVRCVSCRDGEPLRLRSTLGRELAFVLSHSIHHCATIASMARHAGATVPEGFGVAPSTLAHQDAARCAR